MTPEQEERRRHVLAVRDRYREDLRMSKAETAEWYSGLVDELVRKRTERLSLNIRR